MQLSFYGFTLQHAPGVPLLLQVRVGALECLQRAVVAAEKFAVPPAVVQRVLQQLLVPMTADMCRIVATGSNRDFPAVGPCINTCCDMNGSVKGRDKNKSMVETTPNHCYDGFIL